MKLAELQSAVQGPGSEVVGEEEDSLGSEAEGSKLEAEGEETEEENIIEYLQKVVFRGVAEFFEKVIFYARVTFKQSPTFSKDTAGIAIIPEFSDRVEVKFAEEYEQAPVVTISLLVDDSEGAEFMYEGLQAGVSEATTEGFKIVLNQYAASELKFSWMALAVGEIEETMGVSEVKDAVENLTSEVLEDFASEEGEEEATLSAEASPSAEASESGEKKE